MENNLVSHTYEDVKEIFQLYIKNPEDRENIHNAYLFALSKHEGQFRKSGEPYICHLIETAYNLALLQAGPSTIIAGFLHDVVEDCNISLDEIKTMFGNDIYMLVEAVTKIQQLQLSRRDEAEFEAEGHRKIFIAMAKDIRVIIIKLADRLHNMRTLGSLKPNRRVAIARETLEVYAPIAHRLGINKVKSELEDLSLKYLEPEKYETIQKLLETRTQNRTKSLQVLKKKLADLLLASKIGFEIESRVKSIYSIYKKMYLKDKNFDEIYDVLALRIITETELNCYEILGLIHSIHKPIPGRFKDYIAMPKPNLYQSLHTTIVAHDGNIFEVQIRTKDMDEIAENGIAAHWRYKEGRNYNPQKEQKEIEEKLHWFRDFVNTSNENLSENAKEYMDSLTKDIFDANVYVFTPKGKIIDLPNGSTPLDFAYRIHTGVGDSAIGAIVNSVLVPLNTILKTGDVVEIRTSKTSPGPNEGWLKIVQTQSAKNHIKKFLAKKNSEFIRDDLISKGKISLVDAFRDRGYNEKQMHELISNEKVYNNYNVNGLDDLYILVANKTVIPSNLIDFLNIKKNLSIESFIKKNVAVNNTNPVIVTNAGKVAINLGMCCTPIPGDDIIGYITKGKGITVHRITCPNIKNEKARLVDVFWNENLALSTYPVDIAIEASERGNLLVDVLACLAQLKCQVTAVNAKIIPNTLTNVINVKILVSDAKRLSDVFNVLTNISGVFKVTRIVH